MVEYYQHIKEEYRNYIKRYPPEHRQLVDTINFLKEKLKGLKFDSVFEVGCGYCMMAQKIMDEFNPKRYVGIDLSEDQIKLANEKLERYINTDRIEVILGDIIKYRDRRKFDLVWCSTAISHIPPDYIDKAIENMCKLGKKHIIIFEPTVYSVDQIRRTDDQWLYDFEPKFLKNSWKLVESEHVPGYPKLIYMRFGR